MGRIIALDLGDRRIGVAISDPLGLTAQGKEVITRKSEKEDIQRINDIVNENNVEEVIVGMPRNMNGTYGPRAQITGEFVGLLEKKLSVPVRTWDERLTTSEAEKILVQADMSRQKRKGVIDKLAAVLILQNYLDSKRRS